jgi:hypothetical protein
VDWKEGKDLTKKKVKKMQMNYKTKEQRILVTTVALETFFNIFVNLKCVEADAKVTSELEEAYQVAEDLYELC